MSVATGHSAGNGRTETAVGRPLSAVLALLTVFGPISMDLYLPVLPRLAADLGAATPSAQLTITSCLVGLALGQIIAGPLSDRFGRRRPLIIGVSAYVVASIVCAISPSIEVLIAARLLQGLAGATGVVIAQAAGRDLYSGNALVRYYARLTVLAGCAAIVGPLIGGQLAGVTDWRGIFVFLATVGAAILLAVLMIFRESLPVASRTSGGFSHFRSNVRVLVIDRRFVGAALTISFLNGATFAYLSGATFVLQGIYHLTPQQYSYAFGLGSLAFVLSGYLSGRLSHRYSRHATLVLGLTFAVAGSAGILSAALIRLPLIFILVAIVIMTGGIAISTPPATALALTDYPQMAGTASSLLGLGRYAFGAMAAPLVGLAGQHSAVPLGAVTLTCAVLAAAAYLITRHAANNARTD
jgi:MFS transporter, DHA1 family, multidrug resistance protein